jgi:hypothetical protein
MPVGRIIFAYAKREVVLGQNTDDGLIVDRPLALF